MSAALVAFFAVVLLLGLFLKGVIFGGKRHSLALAGPCAPGELLRAYLLTDERPAQTSVACELYREDDDNPVRSVEAAIDPPQRGPDGWRCDIRVVLPTDARPSFAGGWALIVEGRTEGGRRILQMEPIILKEA
jgi:hypothetical protein